jgi:hypothetical protein
MKKQELINKIKNIVIKSNDAILINADTNLGQAYSLFYNDEHESVEVDVIMHKGDGLNNPATVTIDIEYLDVKSIENILNAIA